ncbi:MAG TPA: hypothetical protein VHP54_09015 [Caproiciproducens sp.]|nr:hypothetical protein [Caproiciproducens sp.]
MNKAERKMNASGIQLAVPRMVGQPPSAAAGFFMDAVLVLLGVFGAVWCSVTAFGLPILPMEAVFFTLVLSVLLTAVFHIRRYRYIFLFGLVLIFSAFVYLYRSEVRQGFLITVNRIIRTYAKYSGFEIQGYEVTAKAAQYPLFCTAFVLCAVFVLAYFLSWAIVTQHSFLLAFSATFPFLLGSLLFHITPQFYAILLLAACWGTMIFMQLPAGDKQDFEKKARFLPRKKQRRRCKKRSGGPAGHPSLLCADSYPVPAGDLPAHGRRRGAPYENYRQYQ